MHRRSKPLVVCAVIMLMVAQSAHAFLEDLCLPRRDADKKLSWCLNPNCAVTPPANTACPQQVLDFATIMPGRSMLHADSTYFIALALG